MTLPWKSVWRGKLRCWLLSTKIHHHYFCTEGKFYHFLTGERVVRDAGFLNTFLRATGFRNSLWAAEEFVRISCNPVVFNFTRLAVRKTRVLPIRARSAGLVGRSLWKLLPAQRWSAMLAFFWRGQPFKLAKGRSRRKHMIVLRIFQTFEFLKQTWAICCATGHAGLSL